MIRTSLEIAFENKAELEVFKQDYPCFDEEISMMMLENNINTNEETKITISGTKEDIHTIQCKMLARRIDIVYLNDCYLK